MDKKTKISELNLEAAIRQVAESYSDEAAQLAAEIAGSRSEIRRLRASMKAVVSGGTTMIERFDRIIGDKEDTTTSGLVRSDGA